MSKEVILVIEPNRKYAKKVADALSYLKCKTEITDNFCRGIQKIQEGKVQIVIMEAEMKEIKGYEAIPIIKNIDNKIPLIIITSNNSKDLERKIREGGIFYYHIKSFDMKDLKLAITNAQKVIEQRKVKNG